jgi:hypothetical protein
VFASIETAGGTLKVRGIRCKILTSLIAKRWTKGWRWLINNVLKFIISQESEAPQTDNRCAAFQFLS